MTYIECPLCDKMMQDDGSEVCTSCEEEHEPCSGCECYVCCCHKCKFCERPTWDCGCPDTFVKDYP